MIKNNKICICCQSTYTFCPTCAEAKNLEAWKNIFCSNNCREIFNATSMYGKDSDDVVKAKLDTCDLSNKDNFHKNIIKVIDELYSIKNVIDVAKEPIVQNVEKVENSTVEEVVKTTGEDNVEETLEDVLEKQTKTETKEVKTVYKNRKRNK